MEGGEVSGLAVLAAGVEVAMLRPPKSPGRAVLGYSAGGGLEAGGFAGVRLMPAKRFTGSYLPEGCPFEEIFGGIITISTKMTME